MKSGTMNTKGLFWGSNTNDYGVKVFGIEHFWGNVWRKINGIVSVNGVYKYKLTRGTQDGSTATDYNNDGSGYITNSSLNMDSLTTSKYVKAMHTGNFGFLPKESGGSDSTYYCDAEFVDKTITSVPQFGGGRTGGSSEVGLFFTQFDHSYNMISLISFTIITCKPLANQLS